MNRVTALLVSAPLAVFAFPSTALAAGQVPAAVMSMVRLGVSLVGLLVAVLLLLEAARVGQVAAGGAIAEKISYVVLAILCLASSALARWVQNFASGVTIEQVQLASETLVIVAMALLALYFSSVRKALRDFLRSMTGSQMLDSEQGDRGPGEREDSSRG